MLVANTRGEKKRGGRVANAARTRVVLHTTDAAQIHAYLVNNVGGMTRTSRTTNRHCDRIHQFFATIIHRPNVLNADASVHA